MPYTDLDLDYLRECFKYDDSNIDLIHDLTSVHYKTRSISNVTLSSSKQKLLSDIEVLFKALEYPVSLYKTNGELYIYPFTGSGLEEYGVMGMKDGEEDYDYIDYLESYLDALDDVKDIDHGIILFAPNQGNLHNVISKWARKLYLKSNDSYRKSTIGYVTAIESILAYVKLNYKSWC